MYTRYIRLFCHIRFYHKKYNLGSNEAIMRRYMAMHEMSQKGCRWCLCLQVCRIFLKICVRKPRRKLVRQICGMECSRAALSRIKLQKHFYTFCPPTAQQQLPQFVARFVVCVRQRNEILVDEKVKIII